MTGAEYFTDGTVVQSSSAPPPTGRDVAERVWFAGCDKDHGDGGVWRADLRDNRGGARNDARTHNKQYPAHGARVHAAFPPRN